MKNSFVLLSGSKFIRLSINKIFIILMFTTGFANCQESLLDFASQKLVGRSILIQTNQGQSLKVTPYGDYILRVQAARQNEDFYPDDRYEMVESHQWPGKLSAEDKGQAVHLLTGAVDGISIFLQKNPVRLAFLQNNSSGEFLKDESGITWEGDTISVSFKSDTSEHFAGLGHDYFGRVSELDLKGQIIKRNYGWQHRQQAPLVVPFYLSSKGYGVFLNSTFPNSFCFSKNGRYEFSISGGGQMDYFIIAGPELEKILERYTQLTGKPRFPPKAALGLALSDKGNDHNSSDPSDEKWWKRKITEHRNAGFPFDHIINDNRWRAGGGQRCESYFDWDLVRYPDPKEYEDWIIKNGLFLTIDFNRCIASKSEGWKKEYNIPKPDSIDFGDSAPDMTKKEVRDWFWELFWKKSLNPALHYPGDALWIDEFDEMGNAPLSMVLGNGRTWREMKNYWFFLVAKALVQDGWDKSFNGSKRPFVWVRGMTAGAQRYATLWSGDIIPRYDEMKMQIRGLQAAGLAGFPFWGHDAGGFFDYQSQEGPDDNMYRQWSLAFGSFTPYWKPHGPGHSRWPLDRSPEVQKDAKKYCSLRYELMPYIYTYAHVASETGIPMVRPMILEHQMEPLAWKNDLQYMWGKEFLVAPNCSDSSKVSVWLPEGNWYDYWSDSLLTGSRVLSYTSPLGQLPLFVKPGSIIPMSGFALSTAFIPSDSLTIHVYTGNDGAFKLYEDDGITEAYRKGEKRLTDIIFNQNDMTLKIQPAQGTYKNAPDKRSYKIVYHGLSRPNSFMVNGKSLKYPDSAGKGILWNEKNKTLLLLPGSFPVSEEILVKLSNDHVEE